MYQLLETISFIHSKDIIHRNITPDNIVFAEKCRDFTLKIINFENSLYVGDPDEIQDFCSLRLTDLDVKRFLKIRNVLMNFRKNNIKPDKEELKDYEGSFAFLAPERVKSIPYSKNVDIFSAGVIFYILLTRRHPYPHLANCGYQEYIEKIDNLPDEDKEMKLVKKFKGIPEEIIELIRSMIELDPKKR